MKNINFLVERFRLNLNLGTTQFDQQFLQWAIDGYRKLNNLELVPGAIKAVELAVVNDRANLPVDFSDFIRIGVCRHGEFISFDRNDELCAPADGCACDTPDIETNMNQCCNGEGANGNGQ